MKKFILCIFFMISIFMISSYCEIKVEDATVSYVYGIVKMKPAGTSSWQSVKLNSKLNIGDSIKTGRRSKAEINISGKKIIKIKPDSQIEIPEVLENQGGLLQTIKLLFGYIYVNGKKVDGEFNVQTPKAICGIRGTRYALEVRGPREILTVFSGRVHYGSMNKKISKLVQKGQSIVVTKAESVKTKVINTIKEESKVIREFIQKESEKIENMEEEILGNIEELQDNPEQIKQDLKPTDTPSVGTGKNSGDLKVNW